MGEIYKSIQSEEYDDEDIYIALSGGVEDSFDIINKAKSVYLDITDDDGDVENNSPLHDLFYYLLISYEEVITKNMVKTLNISLSAARNLMELLSGSNPDYMERFISGLSGNEFKDSLKGLENLVKESAEFQDEINNA